jgi:hypothetical protein
MALKKEILKLKDWAIELNIPYNSLRVRIQDRKWSVEKAFTTPIIKRIR